MSANDNGTEYIFILPDGSRRFEIVMQRSDVWALKSMHGAVSCMPLRMYEDKHGEIKLEDCT